MTRIRSLLLLLALIGIAPAAEPEAAPVPLNNRRCIDGQPIDPALGVVVLRVDGQAYQVRVASRENADAIRKMDPREALKALRAYNRE